MSIKPIKSTVFHLGGDLTVNRLGFGAMRLSTNGFRGPARDAETGRKVLRRAVELGVNLIDTADFYQCSDGSVRANDLIKEALFPYESDLIIATKVGVVFNNDGSYRHARGSDMRQLIEGNLHSLGLETLDLVYLRIGDMGVPHGESLAERYEALVALQEEGLIRHLGLSNVDAEHLKEAQSIAPVTAVQNHFHINKRDDIELFKACAQQNIAFCPFFPLGGGAINIDQALLSRIAQRHNATPSQVALSWLLAYSSIMLAIPGTGSITHLEENVAASNLQLTDEDYAELSQS